MTGPSLEVIRTSRLDLVPLPLEWLDALAAGGPLPDLGFTDPYGFLPATASAVAYRREQLHADPSEAPWLLRAVVERATGAAVGYVNFHAPPDERGMVEIGYQVVLQCRRRGIAAEAAAALWAWGARHGATVLRASVAPDNVPSLALIRRAGFVQVGEQMDEIDGLELVFERPVEPAGPDVREDGGMDEKRIMSRIDEIVAEEHELRSRAAGDGLDADERARLRDLEEHLDQAWDLLRQRRARSEAGQDPGEAQERPVPEVESYLQ